MFIKFRLEILPHVSPLKDEQREVVVRLLRSKNFVTILPTGFGKILIYQPLRNVKGNANDVVVTVSPLTQKEQIEEMEEIKIPSILLSTKEDVLLPIDKRNTSLFSVERKVFVCNIPYKDSPIHN